MWQSRMVQRGRQRGMGSLRTEEMERKRTREEEKDRDCGLCATHRGEPSPEETNR